MKQKNKNNKKNKKTKKINFFKKFVTGLTLLVAIIILLVGTETGRSILIGYFSSYISSSLQEPVEGEYSDVDDGIGDEVVDVNDAAMGIREEDYVRNYLLLGIEKIDGASNTDAMIIASIDTRNASIKLTSILRDTLVNIPGYSQNKLNSVYSKGGAKLLIRVLEENFRIKLDGYASVDFADFEAVIDKLGGVEIEISQQEADYLNTTNYISKPEYRTLKAGLQNINGNQALGYCRVRKVETLEGVNYDYGRTLRQRRVLKAIFEKYKTLNVFEMFSVANECLGYITTDITGIQIKNELTNVVENGITEIEMFRIPADGYFESVSKVGNVTSVLIPDLDINTKLLHEFIFEE